MGFKDLDYVIKFKQLVARIIQAYYNDITPEMGYEDIINYNNKLKRSIIPNKTFYFWGYGNTTCNEFYDILQKWKKNFNISHIIDIRINPFGWAGCYHKPWFKKNIEKYNLTYEHIKELGNPGCDLDSYKRCYLLTKQFFDGLIYFLLTATGAVGESKNILLFCAELYYSQCHRKIIANVLQNKPLFLNVKHLSEKAKK